MTNIRYVHTMGEILVPIFSTCFVVARVHTVGGEPNKTKQKEYHTSLLLLGSIVMVSLIHISYKYHTSIIQVSYKYHTSLLLLGSIVMVSFLACFTSVSYPSNEFSHKERTPETFGKFYYIMTFNTLAFLTLTLRIWRKLILRTLSKLFSTSFFPNYSAHIFSKLFSTSFYQTIEHIFFFSKLFSTSFCRTKVRFT